MDKELYIDASHPMETRVVVKSNGHIEEYEYENKLKTHIKNNIYLGKVSRVEPSLQAAFINFGRKRHGFLAFNDIQTDYYQIPHDDKEKIKQKEEEIREQLKETEHLEEEKSESEEPKGDIEQQIWDQLKTCYDPEIPINIFELGLIYGLDISDMDGGKSVNIKMTLTAPGCGMGPMIAGAVSYTHLTLPTKA